LIRSFDFNQDGLKMGFFSIMNKKIHKLARSVPDTGRADDFGIEDSSIAQELKFQEIIIGSWITNKNP